MTMKQDQPSRLTQEILGLADDMRDSGVLSDIDHRKLTMPLLNRAGGIPEPTPITGPEIRELREHARMSQAVFARYLNMTVGYVSQLERGARRPIGPALVLLNVIRRHGIETIIYPGQADA